MGGKSDTQRSVRTQEEHVIKHLACIIRLSDGLSEISQIHILSRAIKGWKLYRAMTVNVLKGRDA